MDISRVTPEQLRKAADLKESIDALQAELDALLGGGVPAPVQVAIEAAQAPGNGRRKRRISAALRKARSEAMKARWAESKAAGRRSL
jgi:hypothetical protein